MTTLQVKPERKCSFETFQSKRVMEPKCNLLIVVVSISTYFIYFTLGKE